MFIMPSAPAILLLVCAFNACVVSTNPVPDNSPPWTLQYAKRAGVNITVFNDTSCGQDYEGPRPGSLVLTEWELNLTYGEMVNTSFTIQSYNLSRFLSSSERLDWSGPYASDTVPRIPEVPEACGSYDQTTSPDSNGNPLHEETCYLLDPGATTEIGLKVVQLYAWETAGAAMRIMYAGLLEFKVIAVTVGIVA